MKSLFGYLARALLYGAIDELVDWLRAKLRDRLYGGRPALAAPEHVLELEDTREPLQLTAGS